jgi:ankyrin repeat protein
LMHASWNGHALTVSRLLEAGADSSVRDPRGRTALDLAQDSNSMETVALLVAAMKP